MLHEYKNCSNLKQNCVSDLALAGIAEKVILVTANNFQKF